jgi:hypothetical protein
MKHSVLIVLLLLASVPGVVFQNGSSLPERDEITRITIDNNPLHLYTTESLLETLPCFKPVKGGSAETPKLADRGLIELKNGTVIEWFATDERSLVTRTREGGQLFELSGDCAQRRAGPAMKLHRYFFSRSDFPELMPKRIERAVVERFLREILDWKYPKGMPLQQLRQVALFYDMQGIVPDLLSRLNARKTNGLGTPTFHNIRRAGRTSRRRRATGSRATLLQTPFDAPLQKRPRTGAVSPKRVDELSRRLHAGGVERGLAQTN